jgi:hypothetical protein
MKSCLLCTRGKSCQGYVIHELVLKLYHAMEAMDASVEEIARKLSLEDLTTLDKVGGKARVTCWSKAYRLAVSHLIVEIGTDEGINGEEETHIAIQRMTVRMDSTFAKLPKGVSIDLDDMILDIYNLAVEEINTTGKHGLIPANVLRQMTSEARAK